MTRTVNMLVFGRNAEGAPDVYRTTVYCNQAHYDAGEHYAVAMSEAALHGFDPALAADERDPAYTALIAPRRAEQAGAAGGDRDASRTRYVCDVTVADHVGGVTETLEVHVDEATGAMFAVDATYLDQVRDCIVSPYTGRDVLCAEPPEQPPAANLPRVAIAEVDMRAMTDELQAARLEMVECYRWASTRSAPLERARVASLKARADSIEAVLGRLERQGQSVESVVHGQIVSVSGDASDPTQDVVVEVYAFVEGGVVQGVTASAPVKVTVVDYDVDGGDGQRVASIPNERGGHDEAEIHEIEVNPDPRACEELAATIRLSDGARERSRAAPERDR